MAAVASKWIPEYTNVPQELQAMQLTRIRERLNAARIGGAIGAYGPAVATIGVDYTNSVTLGEGSPGTAAKPNRVYWHTPGTLTNATKWVKADVTWSGANVTKLAYYFSEDNQATYTPLTDQLGNYVVTFTYSGADLQSATWSNIP